MSNYSNTQEKLSRDDMAQTVAADIPSGAFVNLGIGQPTNVSNFLTSEQGVTLHTENGMLGMGPVATGDDIDEDLINAGKIPVTELPGASFFHHADSFAMMRGGHLDVCVVSRGSTPKWQFLNCAAGRSSCVPRTESASKNCSPSCRLN
jgi:3-oxoadipate CoA-transferase beta subunit